MQQLINLYCRKCRRSLKMSYVITGDGTTLVMDHFEITCQHCKRKISHPDYTEDRLLAYANAGICQI